MTAFPPLLFTSVRRVSTEGDEEVELSEEARVRLRNLRNKVVVDEPLNKRQKRMHQMQEVAGKGRPTPPPQNAVLLRTCAVADSRVRVRVRSEQ
jgi:hypothetical protein